MSNRLPRNPEIHQCKLCHRYHSLRFCRSFLAMGPTDRRRVVHQYRYCVNCLARTHSVNTCDSPDTCMYCEQLHHTLLHQHRRTRTPSSRRSVHERLGEPPTSANRQTASARSRNQSTAANGNATRRRRVIRQTTSSHSTRRHNTDSRQARTTNNNIRRRKRRNEQLNQPETSTAAPNQRILSEAIRSLAEVLCASTTS